MNTKNWSHLTTDSLPVDTKQLFYKYDELVSLTLTKLQILSAQKGKIQLLSFNRKNIEHLYMLRIALIARDLFGLPIEIEASWFDVLRINWKIGKNFGKIKRMPWKDIEGIPTSIVLKHMRDEAKERFGLDFNFDFGDIYHAYYEGSLN
jgi:hypothetical protein